MKRSHYRSLLVACGALSVTLFACSTTTSELRARFARENDCPASQVSVAERGAEVYVARGCQRETEYVCEDFAMSAKDVRACEIRGLPRRADASEPRPFPEGDRPPMAPAPPR